MLAPMRPASSVAVDGASRGGSSNPASMARWTVGARSRRRPLRREEADRGADPPGGSGAPPRSQSISGGRCPINLCRAPHSHRDFTAWTARSMRLADLWPRPGLEKPRGGGLADVAVVVDDEDPPGLRRAPAGSLDRGAGAGPWP